MHMGPDDFTSDGPESWDGRKTADFARVSNDGLWRWDGSEWAPQKKGEIQVSSDQSSQHSSAKPDEIASPMVTIQNQQTVKEMVSIETGSISPDGHHEWDGSKWIPVELTKLSDDGVWMWNGKEWIPNPDRLVDNKEPTQSQFKQIQNNQVAQYPGYDQNSQMLLIQQTKKSNNGLWISLVIIVPIILLTFTLVVGGMLLLLPPEPSEGLDQTDLAGTWYNNADTMTLYSNGSVDESSGLIIEWSSEGENLTTTFLIDGEETDVIWKYEIKIDSDYDRILFMAYFDSENGVQTNQVAENSCIAYVDSVKGTEEDYMERKRAIIPDWCEFIED